MLHETKECSGLCSEITASRCNMYRYRKVHGVVLSDSVTIPLFEHFLEFCVKFWEPKKLTGMGLKKFNEGCEKFYREKTLERVGLFYKNFGHQDSETSINGIFVPKLSSIMAGVDWDWLSEGAPGQFHGDFHFENILWNEADREFVLLDWRQDFAGDLVVGDIYYDLAKLVHGLIVNHGLVARNQYAVSWEGNEIVFDLYRRQVLVECEQLFKKWLANQGFDEKKVVTLVALIYLNIAALHHYPYCLLLYALGKSMLFKAINGNQ